jgi:Tfp pilus assembly protein PilX
MRPASRDARCGDARRGFALPLSLFMLMVVALLVALLLEGAVQDLRTSRGDLAAARAQAAAGTALADFFALGADSALLAAPRGATATSTRAAGAETTRVALQALGGGLVRVTATTRFWSAGVRADAEILGLAHLTPDSGGAPGRLRIRRLPGWWWAQLP